MARKRKGRSVRNNTQIKEEPESLKKAPHSFIVCRGKAKKSLIQLSRDFRKVMEPFTAVNLKERKRNTVKDFIAVSGFFNVSHLCVFSANVINSYVKITKLPNGPVITFRLMSYSLMKDILSAEEGQSYMKRIFQHAPLVVMNNFKTQEPHLKLAASLFQNMVPPLNLKTVNLNSIKRCLLINYNSTKETLDVRHYAVKIVPTGTSEEIGSFIQGKVPDLSGLKDISEFLVKSDVKTEVDESEVVDVKQKIKARGIKKDAKSLIKLAELGPRMTLKLAKVQNSLTEGATLFAAAGEENTPGLEAKPFKRKRKKKESKSEGQMKRSKISPQFGKNEDNAE